jgi:D-inositol-3-phosphate glycosyltransferase
LVALESQACGTPVVAARVGGLATAVQDGVSGLLIDGHHPDDYSTALRALLREPARRLELSTGAVRHAERFGWGATVERILAVYDAL